jgi:hypothetical protein
VLSDAFRRQRGSDGIRVSVTPGRGVMVIILENNDNPAIYFPVTKINHPALN